MTATSTSTSTTTTVPIGDEGDKQSVAFCNMAALGTLDSVLRLGEGNRQESLNAYQNAEEQARRAGRLDSTCPVPTTSVLDHDEVKPLAGRFEQLSGLPRGEILSHVNDMTSRIASGSSQGPVEGLLGLIGKFEDVENQEKLRNTLNGEGGEPAPKPAEEKPGVHIESNIAAGGRPPKVASDFPVSAGSVEAAKPSKPVTMTKEQKELITKKTRILEEMREKELNELSSIIEKNEAYDRDQADQSLFNRVQRVYRVRAGGMARPEFTDLELKKKK